jgi:hypothetical protein
MRALRGAEMDVASDRSGAIANQPSVDIKADQLIEGLDEALQHQLASSLVQIVARFPAEPVGIGATWDTTTKTDVNTIPTTLVSTYRLTGIEGSTVTLDVVQLYRFNPGKFEFGPGGETVDANVISGSLTARGTITWDLHGVLPLREVVLDGEDTIDVDNGLETVRTHESIHQETTVASR